MYFSERQAPCPSLTLPRGCPSVSLCIMKRSFAFFPLLILILLFSCNKKQRDRNTVQEIRDESITENVQDASERTPQTEAENVQEENLVDTKPEQMFPLETWLVDSDLDSPVEAFHPLIGPLLPLDPSEDQKTVYKKCSELMSMLPEQAPVNYYPIARQALKKKITHLGLQGESLLGAPRIEGPTAEVHFLIYPEEKALTSLKGTFYWIFDKDQWYLEDITFP